MTPGLEQAPALEVLQADTVTPPVVIEASPFQLLSAVMTPADALPATPRARHAATDFNLVLFMRLNP
jgi:hypothetical protein